MHVVALSGGKDSTAMALRLRELNPDTDKVRVKDRHGARLKRMARGVNFIWNYINELSSRAIRERALFLSAYDLHPYTKGAGKTLGRPAGVSRAHSVPFFPVSVGRFRPP